MQIPESHSQSLVALEPAPGAEHTAITHPLRVPSNLGQAWPAPHSWASWAPGNLHNYFSEASIPLTSLSLWDRGQQTVVHGPVTSPSLLL